MPLRRIADEENFTIRRPVVAQRDTRELQHLSQLISPDEQQWFLKRLFGDDSARFDKLLRTLESAPDWRTAHRLIQTYFSAHHINPYQDDATRFTDRIYKRYFPKDHLV